MNRVLLTKMPLLLAVALYKKFKKNLECFLFSGLLHRVDAGSRSSINLLFKQFKLAWLLYTAISIIIRIDIAVSL
jgi:hypothetical protein